jgi:hypothetical protein
VGDVRAKVGADSEQGRGFGVRADPGQGFSHCRAGGGELGEGDERRIGRLASNAPGLGLRGRKQDQHLAKSRRAEHGPYAEVLARVTFMSMRWVNLLTDKQGQRGSWADPALLGHAFDAVRTELKVPQDFPPEVIAEEQAVAGEVALPARDETAVPFLTVVRKGSRDLGQAIHIERAGEGYRVRCAIADVPAFVRPGGELDTESFKRGQAIYACCVRLTAPTPDIWR